MSQTSQIDPKIIEYFAKPESERSLKTSSPEFDGPAEAIALAKAEAVSHAKPDSVFLATSVQPEQNKKRGFFSFLRRKPKNEIQKQLPVPNLFPCGICNKSVGREDLFKHWFEHTVTVPDDQNRAGNDSPMRSTSKPRSMAFIVRRPTKFPQRYEYVMDRVHWSTITPFDDMELAIAKYFAYAITRLRQEQPGTRFQYQPTNTTEYGWQTLLVIAEWDEE